MERLLGSRSGSYCLYLAGAALNNVPPLNLQAVPRVFGDEELIACIGLQRCSRTNALKSDARYK
jgi:hypothetical protein